MSDVKPPEKPTVELPKVPDWAVELTRATKQGFSNVETTLLDFGERLVRVEIRQKDLEERMTRTSERTREPSQHDLAAQAEIAQERAAREALAKKVTTIEEKNDAQTEILTRLDARATELIKNPKVIALLFAVWSFAMQWLARHT